MTIKKNRKYYIKTNIIGFIVGGLLISGVAVYAAVTFPSNDVTYDNKESGLSSTDVQGAIDEIYNICTTVPSGSDTITDLVDTNTDELYEDEHGDIRYYGANPNNYVSFNNELWRIIGVIDGKIKIIRNESVGNYQWSSSGSNNWSNSSLKSYLNGDYYNSIVETYKNMISEETYYLGGATSSNYQTLTTSDYYDAERSNTVYSGNPVSTTQHIGLMYPSDYGYAAGEGCLSTELTNYDDSCKNIDYLSVGIDEWLQTPFPSNSFQASILFNSGSVSSNIVNFGSFGVRSVAYLLSSVKITGGDGSQNNPFQLSL